MRVVRPHDDLARRAKVREQLIESLGHVTITKIPARDSSVKHGPVVAFSILYHARVLLGGEELVRFYPSVTTREVDHTASHLDQLTYHFVFTGLAQAKTRGVAIGLNVFPELFETSITIAGPLPGFAIHFVEIVEHGARRGMEAVQIHAVKARLPRSVRQ